MVKSCLQLKMELIFPFGNNGLESLRNVFKREFINSLLIIGPSSSCKTSLLMQAAISEAHNGSQVLFISPQKLSKLPKSVHGMLQPSSHTMKNIYFLYAKNNSELQGYLSTLHIRPLVDKPSVIIVDDLNHYCKPEDGDALDELVCFSKLTGLIYEAASFPHFDSCETDTEQTGGRRVLPGFVLMSWNGRSKSFLSTSELEEVAKRNFDQTWKIKTDNKKTTHKTFRMETENAKGSYAITFSLRDVNPTLEVLYLEDVLASRTEDALLDKQEVTEPFPKPSTSDAL